MPLTLFSTVTSLGLIGLGPCDFYLPYIFIINPHNFSFNSSLLLFFTFEFFFPLPFFFSSSALFFIMDAKTSIVLDGVTFVAPKEGEGIDPTELMANILTDSFLPSAIAQEVLPSCTKAIFPSDPDVHVDWTSPGWFGMYESAFKMFF